MCMRGDLKNKILENILETAISPAELFEAVIRAGYGASVRGIDWQLEKVRARRQDVLNILAKKKSFYNTLQRLKRDGLIERSGKGWIATKLGRGIFTVSDNRPSRSAYPSTEKTSYTTIIIFDVPETHRYKRDWLRDSLKNMGFKMVQKSVWSAQVKIPRAFIDDLESFALIDCVDIFQATKLGSLAKS